MAEQQKAPFLTHHLELVQHITHTPMSAVSANADVKQCSHPYASLPFLKSHACAQALAMKQMG